MIEMPRTRSRKGNHVRRLYLATGFISASAIAYEILLMRLLSIVQWHHFAHMIISLALLGYGASGPFRQYYPRVRFRGGADTKSREIVLLTCCCI